MQKVLFVWDARNAPRLLQFFINNLIDATSDYEIDARFLSFTKDKPDGVNECQYSMRALLNAVHHHKPDLIISFGSESNFLSKLIKPSLKVPLICNNLPNQLEYSGSVKKHINRVTKPFCAHCSWLYHYKNKHSDYLIPETLSKHSYIGIIKSDPLGPVLANLAQQQGIEFKYFSIEQFDSKPNSIFFDTGLILLSVDLDKQHIVGTVAASFGCTTLYIGKPNSQYSKKILGMPFESVSSTRDIGLIKAIKYWKELSIEQRLIVSVSRSTH